MLIFRVIFAAAILGLCLSHAAIAEFSESTAASPTNEIFAFASQFTVKVNTQFANVFTGNTVGGHGTGFLTKIRTEANGDETGIIFTNRHVVKRPSSLFAQKVTLEFPTDTEVPDVINASVVYESQYNDFAVLEFNMKDLKRVKTAPQPALLPDPNSPFYKFSQNYRSLQGLDVLAHGNPLNSDSITTYGKITGRWSNPYLGDFIQTQTPINPGNSGGPLIDRRSGVVVGINTLKHTGADNTGFALPIGVALDDYNSWIKDPSVARKKTIGVMFGVAPKDEIQALGFLPVLQANYPEFFAQYSAALKVTDANSNAELKTGDVVIKVNGAYVSPSHYQIIKAIQLSNKSMRFEVIRNGQIVMLNVPVRDVAVQQIREELDFVYLSGMLFRDRTVSLKKAGQSSVMLEMNLDSPELAFSAGSTPPELSKLAGVNIDNQDYNITNVRDLKQALIQHPTARTMRLTVYEPVLFRNANGEIQPALDALMGVVYQPITNTYVVSVAEALTPANFSINKFKRQFSFAKAKPETRDWRRFVIRTSCSDRLLGAQPEQ